MWILSQSKIQKAIDKIQHGEIFTKMNVEVFYILMPNNIQNTLWNEHIKLQSGDWRICTKIWTSYLCMHRVCKGHISDR